MKIALEIEATKEGMCGKKCMFRSGEIFDDCATCTLFNKTLRPKKEYDYVESWHVCAECWAIARPQ